ncbi:uncharacterized protein LOC100208127 isoform X2 [Hydra vulgaris]|uniref:Uncharacterized protein LOC100208127 isoform X2 n=1 Tax=Hydra vulgaris TaxID=6087 RepID=A0ABM4BFJ9_HYDVU
MGSTLSIKSDSDDICKNTCATIPENISIDDCSFANTIIVPLSHSDIFALQGTWLKVKARWFEICTIAFERWLVADPEIRTLFKDLPDTLHSKDLMKHNSLKKHAYMIEKTLDQVLLILDKKKEFVNTLIELGKLHYRLGANHKYTKGLALSLQCAVCQEVDIDISEESAWDSLFRFMLGLLKLGMRIEMNKQQQIKIMDAD